MQMQASLLALARTARQLMADRGARLVFIASAILVGVVFHEAHAAEDFLEPEKAFQFSARTLEAKSVEVRFAVAPGYYLYREQFKFAAVGATLGTAVLPAGKVKFDETFQKNVETYRGEVRIVVPVQQAGGDFKLVTTSQGCADAGLCYPPMQSAASVSLVGFGGSGTARTVDAADTAGPGTRAVSGIATAAVTGAATASPSAGPIAAPASAVGETSAIEAVLHGGSFWTVVGAFFVAGLLLSLTPCVLPMLPIVSSIIVGQMGHGSGGVLAAGTPGGRTAAIPTGDVVGVSRRRGLALAASYSFGMALVYTAFGVAAGLAGEGLAAALQNPWVLGAFALGLAALSLSMFGVYELQMPLSLRCRVSDAAHKLPGGRVAGVCAMGGVSALIVSPCVAAPLAGALLYLSQTRDVWLGGTALFSLATGMSVPLLLVGASAGALLPRAGAWMVEVKAAFGVLLLGVALWTVQPVMPAPLALFGWGALALVAAGLLVSRLRGRPGAQIGRKAVAALFALVGAIEIVGAASGGSDPLQPLARLASRGQGGDAVAAGMPRFAAVHSVAELDAALKGAGRPVMLDFYADWCVSCKEMERFTFTDPAVQKKLAGALLLKADVTANNADDRELLKRFRLFGPPGTIFFDASGQEIVAARLVGYQDSTRFLRTLQSAGL